MYLDFHHVWQRPGRHRSTSFSNCCYVPPFSSTNESCLALRVAYFSAHYAIVGMCLLQSVAQRAALCGFQLCNEGRLSDVARCLSCLLQQRGEASLAGRKCGHSVEQQSSVAKGALDGLKNRSSPIAVQQQYAQTRNNLVCFFTSAQFLTNGTIAVLCGMT